MSKYYYVVSSREKESYDRNKNYYSLTSKKYDDYFECYEDAIAFSESLQKQKHLTHT